VKRYNREAIDQILKTVVWLTSIEDLFVNMLVSSDQKTQKKMLVYDTDA
jgi:hypothetical protein